MTEPKTVPSPGTGGKQHRQTLCPLVPCPHVLPQWPIAAVFLWSPRHRPRIGEERLRGCPSIEICPVSMASIESFSFSPHHVTSGFFHLTMYSLDDFQVL